MAANTATVYGAHADNVNQQYSVIGVIGTLGTADVGGTAPTLPIGVDPATGAAYVYNLGPAGSVSLGNITGGTIDQVTQVNGGSIVVTAGTVTTTLALDNGTIDLLKAGTITKLEGGTLGLVTRVGNVGTLEVGTISSLPNIPGGSIVVTAGTVTTTLALNNGTIDLLKAGTVTKLEGGTLGLVTRVGNVGTLEVGTISALPNLPQGSIQVTAGTITAGSVIVTAGTVATGTIRVTAGTVGGAAATATALSGNPVPVGGVDAGGTVYGFLTDAKGQQILGGGTVDTLTTVSNLTNGSVRITVGTISVLPNLPQGSINVTAGTITAGTLTNLVSGTINSATAVINSATISVLPNLPQGSINVTAGTITHGTIDSGTVKLDPRTAKNIVTYGTQIVGTAAAVSTIVGSAAVGAGTSLWLQDVSIINPYGTILCVLGNGTAQQGTNVFFRGILGTQTVGGIEKSYANPANAGMTNQDLVFSIGAAGTVDVSISYFISA